MWIRRMVLGMAVVSGVGFGFVLSSCMPPVDGQSSEFPPLTIGETYVLKLAPNASFPDGSYNGILREVGPYPWIELEAGNYIVQVNLDNVAYIATVPAA